MTKFFVFLLLLTSETLAFSQGTVEDAAALKKRRADLWYADSSFTLPSAAPTRNTPVMGAPKNTGDMRLFNAITRPAGYLLGALILGALAYAFYDFTKAHKTTLRHNSPAEPSDIKTVENLYEADFTALIKMAERKTDYRLALRYYYLQLLQEFSRQSLIRYEKNKTNRQYAEEIKNHKWGPSFLEATKYYNFVWYGNRMPSEENYHELTAHFLKMPPYV